MPLSCNVIIGMIYLVNDISTWFNIGSVILHQLSLSMDLDFFIMFSSISGVLGNAGQVSYAAANSFLDQLCEFRRNKLGLPALSVDWGPIGGAGVLERNKNVSSLLETSGFHILHYTEGILKLSTRYQRMQ